eukprot:3058581-Amphidinium_carterae.2
MCAACRPFADEILQKYHNANVETKDIPMLLKHMARCWDELTCLEEMRAYYDSFIRHHCKGDEYEQPVTLHGTLGSLYGTTPANYAIQLNWFCTILFGCPSCFRKAELLDV